MTIYVERPGNWFCFDDKAGQSGHTKQQMWYFISPAVFLRCILWRDYRKSFKEKSQCRVPGHTKLKSQPQTTWKQNQDLCQSSLDQTQGARTTLICLQKMASVSASSFKEPGSHIAIREYCFRYKSYSFCIMASYKRYAGNHTRSR